MWIIRTTTSPQDYNIVKVPIITGSLPAQVRWSSKYGCLNMSSTKKKKEEEEFSFGTTFEPESASCSTLYFKLLLSNQNIGTGKSCHCRWVIGYQMGNILFCFRDIYIIKMYKFEKGINSKCMYSITNIGILPSKK